MIKSLKAKLSRRLKSINYDKFLRRTKMKTSKSLIYSVALIGLLSTFTQGATSTQLFFDDFTGTALDISLWSVFVDAHGQYNTPQVSGGFLQSAGYHTRIDSIPTFAPMGQSVMAHAQIRLVGDYHKFGFAVNPMERTGPITGYYFDTVDGGSGGREHYVRALAWSNPGFGPMINLLDVEIPVTWYEFHEFVIERTPSEIIYSIDGQEVARVADTFAGELPVGVWNDRWSLMQTDWVEVRQVESPNIDALIDINPDTLNTKSHGNWVTVYITLPPDYNVATIVPDTIAITTLGGESCTPDYNQPADPNFTPQVGDRDEDGVFDLTVKFDRQELLLNLCLDDVEITIEGDLSTGEHFSGTDTIRVIQRGK